MEDGGGARGASASYGRSTGRGVSAVAGTGPSASIRGGSDASDWTQWQSGHSGGQSLHGLPSSDSEQPSALTRQQSMAAMRVKPVSWKAASKSVTRTAARITRVMRGLRHEAPEFIASGAWPHLAGRRKRVASCRSAFYGCGLNPRDVRRVRRDRGDDHTYLQTLPDERPASTSRARWRKCT